MFFPYGVGIHPHETASFRELLAQSSMHLCILNNAMGNLDECCGIVEIIIVVQQT